MKLFRLTLTIALLLSIPLMIVAQTNSSPAALRLVTLL